MSKSKANELVQRLYKKLQARWTGKDKNWTATDTYNLCKQIVEEYEKEETEEC